MSKYKPVILIVIEIRCDPSMLNKYFKEIGYDMIESSNNSGLVGGIVMVWKSTEMDVHVCKNREQYIHVSIKYENDKKWNFTAIYAIPNENSKKVLWDELKDISISMHDLWMMAGGFNDIAYVSDKRGSVVPFMSRCRKLRDKWMCVILVMWRL